MLKKKKFKGFAKKVSFEATFKNMMNKSYNDLMTQS